jgi:DNA (cytosine-5)-methyltransferase 1
MQSNPHSWLLSDLKNIKPNGIKVMSTFACGGGSSMGYKRLGCEIVAANDIDPEMAHHYKLNLSPSHYFLCPIKDLIENNLPAELYELDILDGSPPCSSFSVAGSREKDWGKKKHFREGQSEQILDDLFFDYLSLANKLKPRAIIAENVKGLVVGKAKGYAKKITQRFEEIGYSSQLFLINAADCGVPQKRERVFFCAVRKDLCKLKIKLNPSVRWVSTSEATIDLQTLSDDEARETQSTKAERLYWKNTPAGQSLEIGYRKIHGKDSWFNCYRLPEILPCGTLTANHQCFTHWSQSRKLTFAEWKRLGSFPDDYQAKTPSIGKYMIGMSVPPKMTERVAKAVIEQWLT